MTLFHGFIFGLVVGFGTALSLFLVYGWLVQDKEDRDGL